MSDPLNVSEFEPLAASAMDRIAWDYYASGADDEHTLARNRGAWAELELHYRVLVDVSSRSTATTVLGQPVASPVLLAPTAFHRLAHGDGELATVRAAGAAGTAMILSTLSTTPIEEVCAAATGPVWFQLYVYKDRAATEGMVRRAEAAGCRALVLTVDAPLLGQRERDVRNRFHLPGGLVLSNLLPAGLERLDRHATDSGLAAHFADLLDPSLTWKDLEVLAGMTKLPVLVKGVVRPDDARRAVEHGAAGVVVSNHGGRQLDTSPATARVLGPVVDAVADRAEVLVDGGIRRGTDVAKALALGAKAVLIGRPVLWGLAAGGQAGVERVLGLLHAELDRAMALCGAPTVDSLTRDLLG